MDTQEINEKLNKKKVLIMAILILITVFVVSYYIYSMQKIEKINLVTQKTVEQATARSFDEVVSGQEKEDLLKLMTPSSINTENNE